MIAPAAITGLVLAGGRGSRMGGVDKGLECFSGEPLALHVLRRLRPQVGSVIVNANRHLERYAEFGAPVLSDTLPGQPGPLAGVLSGLEAATTPWLMTVPCDCPLFPTDLVERLAARLDDRDGVLALPAIREPEGWRMQPVFCLMRSSLRDALRRFLQDGGRKVEAWVRTLEPRIVECPDAAAFANINSPQDLQRLG